jgi:hypothetical protein
VQISCTQGRKPKKFTLQGANQKKKIIGGKNKTRPHYREYQPIYPKLFINLPTNKIHMTV